MKFGLRIALIFGLSTVVINAAVLTYNPTQVLAQQDPGPYCFQLPDIQTKVPNGTESCPDGSQPECVGNYYYAYGVCNPNEAPSGGGGGGGVGTGGDNGGAPQPYCLDINGIHQSLTTNGLCDTANGERGPLCDSGYAFSGGRCVANSSSGGGGGSGGGSGGATGNTGTPGTGLCAGLNQSATGICEVPNRFGGGLAGARSVGAIIKVVVQLLLALSGAVAVVLIIIGGFQYILSRGNEEAATKGRRTLTYAVIGLVIVILSFAIVTIVTDTLTSSNPINAVTGGNSGSGSGSGNGSGCNYATGEGCGNPLPN